MTDEVWKDISGYEGLYQISDHGRVKSLERWQKTGFGKKHIPETLMALQLLKVGYPTVGLSRDARARTIYVHRLVAEHFLENPDLKRYVNHKDGNKQNNHVSNLEWCTGSENQQHAVDMGLARSGEGCSYAKLSDADVQSIRDLHAEGVDDRELAAKFGVTLRHVRRIWRGKRRSRKTHEVWAGQVRNAKKKK